MAHTTKYGNRYSTKEWADIQTNFAQEEKETEDFFAKLEGMEKYLRRQLSEMGLSQNQINTLTSLFRDGSFWNANIKFSSEDREIKVNDLWNRWNTALN
jgi:hypothetical protein